MSVKKMFIVPAMAAVMVGGTVITNDAYAVGSCKAHKPVVTMGTLVKGFTIVTGTAVGSLAGTGLTAWTLNPLAVSLGTGAGAVFGFTQGKKLGGALAKAVDNDELCTSNGWCLQCDHDRSLGVLDDWHGECEDQIVVTNGAVAYRCEVGSSDHWRKIDIPVCANSPVKTAKKDSKYFKVTLMDNQTNGGHSVDNMPGVVKFSQHVCYYVEEVKDTSGLCVDDKGNRTIIAGELKEITCNKPFGTNIVKEHAVRCKAKCGLSIPGSWGVGVAECEKGYHLEDHLGDGIYKNCVKGKGGGNGGGAGGGAGGGCKAGRASLEGKACCDIPGAEAEWNTITPNQCVCVKSKGVADPDKEFRIEGGKGVCVAKTAPVVEDKCDCAGTSAERTSMRLKCAKNKDVLSVLDKVDAECKKAEKECDGKAFTVYMNTVREQSELPNCGVDTGNNNNDEEKSKANLARITTAVTSIEKRVSSLDASVWKTAEGNFNGARLASDSIAGVVLGTAGGLITSNVVKKNQIKSGFEDIVCTVGGQVVGNYGDQITVGIQ